MLLCHGCHRKIDDAAGQGIYTVDVLRGIKAQHEAMVAALTDFRTESRTLVIATRGTLRQKPVGASQREIAFALAESRRTPHTLGNLTYRVDIDLTDPVSEEWAWQRGMGQIDKAVARIDTDVADGRVDHVSVFALAPVPLLAYLGHKLGDKWAVDVFRRSREQTDRAWCWGTGATEIPVFAYELPDNFAGGDEIVVAVDVTGPVRADRLPDKLSGLPAVRLHPVGTPTCDAILGSPAAVDAFAAGWRGLLSAIERDMPGVRRLHVAAAVPVPAAIAIGRFHRPYIDPALVMYELGDDTRYSRALEFPA